MGIFSSKKKTYVGTSASRLIEDAFVPNSVLSGTTKAIFKDGDVAKEVLADLRRGIGSKARSMYNFGRNNYVFGTPDAKIQTNVIGESQLLAVLSTFAPGVINLEYHHVGTPNILHIARQKLVELHGYNQATNQLGDLSYVHDLVVVVPQGAATVYGAEAIEQWGTPPKTLASLTRTVASVFPDAGALSMFTPVEYSPTAMEDHVRVEHAHLDGAGVLQRGSFTIGNSEFDEHADYFHVGYTLDGVQKYWTYKVGAGTHPSLDSLVNSGDPSQTVGTFFPMIHFRSDKQSMAANTASVEYKDSVKMAKKLGIDYMQIHDAIHENPDIADIEQSYLTLLVPVASTNDLDRKYLFDFFDQLIDSGLGTPAPLLESTAPRAARVVPKTAILVQDKKAKHTLTYTGSSKKLVAGVIGPIDTYISGFVATPSAKKHHYFRRQITSAVYEEIKVLGLEMRYWVEGTYSAVGDEEDAALLIPLDYSISRKYPLPEQEVLYSRSLHLVSNSLVVVKVKWYQRGAFATFLQIVGIVLFFVDGGFTSALASAIAQGAAAVISFIAITLMVNYVVKFAFEVLAKVLGPEFSIFLAVAAAIYGGYQYVKDGLKTALPAINQMLQIANGLLKGTAKVVMDDLMDLGKEFEAFKNEAEEQMKLLDETKALLENSTRLNPMVIFGESPDNFYNRTVHSGNVGTIGYQAIEAYVDMALTLPTISDSLGGVQNEF